jgi:hypothetical protein
MEGLIVRHRVAPEGVERPIDHLVVGPAGVFAVGAPRLSRAVVRAQTDWMREALAARGLAAMPVIACHDLAYAIAAAAADRRFSAATVQRAAEALEPRPAFVADIASAAARRGSAASVPAAASRADWRARTPH